MRVTAAWFVLLAPRFGGDVSAGRVHAQDGAAAGELFETVQIRPNVFVIVGAGGNVTVHTGADGVIVVDSGSAAMADKVLSAVKALGAQPIRYVINTTSDADHVGGNDKLATAGTAFNTNVQFTGGPTAEVVAREEVLLRMGAPAGEQPPFPVALWPTETYTQQVKSMYVNDDGVQIMHMPAAHTDGDSVVFFRRADVVATGDIVDLRRFPVIDRARGGSIQGEIEALNRLLVLAIPPGPLVYKEGRTLLVPGHGRVADHAELVDYRDMVTIVRDIIDNLIK
jgi:glyoxylase-like metal-dependent hydrolase (beta-lactamase superfamily II)